MITALLAKIGLAQWVAELLLVFAVVLGVWYWHHTTYESGIANQRAVDAQSSQILIDQAKAETVAAQIKASIAESLYASTIDDLHTYVAANPLDGSLRLTPTVGGSCVPGAAGKVSGTPPASAAAADIQHLLATDPPVRIGPNPNWQALLSILAERADQVGAQLSEAQGRGP